MPTQESRVTNRDKPATFDFRLVAKCSAAFLIPTWPACCCRKQEAESNYWENDTPRSAGLPCIPYCRIRAPRSSAQRGLCLSKTASLEFAFARVSSTARIEVRRLPQRRSGGSDLETLRAFGTAVGNGITQRASPWASPRQASPRQGAAPFHPPRSRAQQTFSQERQVICSHQARRLLHPTRRGLPALLTLTSHALAGGVYVARQRQDHQ